MQGEGWGRSCERKCYMCRVRNKRNNFAKEYLRACFSEYNEVILWTNTLKADGVKDIY